MKINKKLLTYCIGGGAGISLLSFGSLKIGEKIRYDKNVKHFGILRSKFNNLLKENKAHLKDFAVPKWEDSSLWKTHYNKKPENRAIFIGFTGREKMPLKSPEELRDICYKFLTEQVEKKLDKCEADEGWCDTCLFQKGWYGTSSDY